jgi:hypothetical protein
MMLEGTELLVVILEETERNLLPYPYPCDGNAVSSRRDQEYEVVMKVLREEAELLEVEQWWYLKLEGEAEMVICEVHVQELGGLKGKLWQHEHLLADLPAKQHC